MSETHISSRTYTVVFVALMILLALSAWAAQYNLGPWNVVVAIGISVAKSILVVLFFMHLLHSSNVVRLMAVGTLLWLAIALLLTFSDYLTRGWQTDAMPTYYEAAFDRSDP